jgi:YD repeat-containing protein
MAVAMPPDAPARKLALQVTHLRPLSGHETGLAFAFDLRASDQKGKALTRFATPLTITLQLGDLVNWASRPDWLRPWVGYWDEKQQQWQTITPTLIDEAAGRVTFTTDHLSTFGAGSQGVMVSGWLLNFNDTRVDRFAGALVWEYPLDLPPGPGGIRPDLRLAYNSRRIDGILTWAQSDGVGWGWSIDTAEVIWRNVRRCDSGQSFCWDRVPLLVLNGEALKLVAVSWNGNGPNDGGANAEAYRWDFSSAGMLVIFWQTDALQKVILERQRSNGSWATVREVRFTYGTFTSTKELRILTRLQEWAPDGGGWKSLPPFTFGYGAYANKGWCGSCASEWDRESFFYPRLTRIENGYGGVITASYETPDGGYWQGWNYRVAGRQVTDGLGGGWKETYHYSSDPQGRCYLHNEDQAACKWATTQDFPDGGGGVPVTGGPFLGYREVTVTFQDLAGLPQRVEWTRFALPAGPTHDPWPVRGRPREHQVRNPGGAVLQTLASTYGISPTAGGAHFVFLQRQDTTTDGRTARTEWRYDNYGNVAAVFEHGFLDVSGDERSTHRGYAYNPTAWILDHVAWEHVYDGITENTGGEALQAQTRFFYDGASSFTAPPAKGLLTRVDRGKEGWGWVTEQAAYDAWGNPTVLTDARGFTTTFGYDPSGVYRVWERNALGYTTRYEYYGVNESDPGAGRGPVGALKRVVDSNGAATAYTYDPFGRLRAVVRPGDSWDFPTEEWLYYDGVDRPFTDRWPLLISRLVRGTPGVAWCSGGLAFWERLYYDGLGRRVERQTPGPGWTCSGGGQEIVQYTRYDALGRVAEESLPYFVPQYTYATTPDGKVVTPYRDPDLSQPRARTGYDGLGRAVRVVHPDGTETTTAYAYGRISQVDGNGHYRSHQMDAYGRLVQVNETLTTLEDPFAVMETNRWIFSGHQSLENGGLKNSGTGSSYDANFYRSVHSINCLQRPGTGHRAAAGQRPDVPIHLRPVQLPPAAHSGGGPPGPPLRLRPGRKHHRHL